MLIVLKIYLYLNIIKQKQNKMKKGKFIVNVKLPSDLSNFSKKAIEETLKHNTKTSLLEACLFWKGLAKQWEQNYNELERITKEKEDFFNIK